MTNWDLFELLHVVANKDIHSNWIATDKFELQLIAKNLRLMRDKLGLPERYKPGTMNAGASASRVLEKDLELFREEAEQSLSAQKTNISDWYFIIDFWTDCSLISEIISHQEFSSRVRNPLMPASVKYPFAKIIPKGLMVWPSTLTDIVVNYYRYPEAPKFRTKTDPTTLELVYDASVSKELEWSDECKLDILHLIMQDFGIESERQDLYGLAQKLIETGK